MLMTPLRTGDHDVGEILVMVTESVMLAYVKPTVEVKELKEA
jgi:hypothetical protein